MANLNATAHEVSVGNVIGNLSAPAPILELQPLALADTPPPTGNLVPPQSPSGSVTGQASTWEYANAKMAVQYYTTNLKNAQADGIVNPSPPTQVTAGTAPYGPSIGNSQPTLETTPNAPSGSYSMQGATAITNLTSITVSFAGIAAAQIAVYNFGATGNI